MVSFFLSFIHTKSLVLFLALSFDSFVFVLFLKSLYPLFSEWINIDIQDFIILFHNQLPLWTTSLRFRFFFQWWRFQPFFQWWFGWFFPWYLYIFFFTLSLYHLFRGWMDIQIQHVIFFNNPPLLRAASFRLSYSLQPFFHHWLRWCSLQCPGLVHPFQCFFPSGSS